MWPNPQFPAHLVLFTEEILNGKLHFLYNEGVILSSIHDQIRSSLRILPHLLKKSLMKNFIFCAMCFAKKTHQIPFTTL